MDTSAISNPSIPDCRSTDHEAASELEMFRALGRFPENAAAVTLTDVLATALVAVIAIWAS